MTTLPMHHEPPFRAMKLRRPKKPHLRLSSNGISIASDDSVPKERFDDAYAWAKRMAHWVTARP